MATKSDLQDQLNALVGWYPRSATKAELQYLLDEAEADQVEPLEETVTSASGGASAASFEDVTGLCRQCGKPADHLHQGV